MAAVRLQLSLYVEAAEAVPIEAARRLLDPIQQCLIPAHVTLCREDELGALPTLLARLRQWTDEPPLALSFGAPKSFSGHGWLLPCLAGEPAFADWRRRVLDASEIRFQAPHITLAHPRNPPPNMDAMAAALPLLKQDLTLHFRTIRLIEQQGSSQWTVLEHFTPCRRSP